MKMEFDSNDKISVLDEALANRGPGKKLKSNSASGSLERKNKKCC